MSAQGVKPEYDWGRLRAAINERFTGADESKRPYAQFALHIHLSGGVNMMDMIFAGFTDVNWNNRTLGYWRKSNFLPPGDALDAGALTNQYPELADLLPRISAGEFTANPVIQTRPQLRINNEEEARMKAKTSLEACAKTAGCLRQGPFPHTGRCTTLTPEERKEKSREYSLRYASKKKGGAELAPKAKTAAIKSAPATAPRQASAPAALAPQKKQPPAAPIVGPSVRVPGRFHFEFRPFEAERAEDFYIIVGGKASVCREQALALMADVVDSEVAQEGQDADHL